MADYWFTPKTYGYGAAPANWKGWAATGAFVVVIAMLTLPLAFRPADLPSGPAAWQLATWLAMVAGLTWAFIRLVRAKTDGQWGWRWGK